MNAEAGEAPASHYRFRFGTAEFDQSRHELRVSGQPVGVQRKPLEILALLLARPGEVVTKEELREAVWQDRPTVEHVIASAVAKLRGALGDGNAARIVTLPRIGYRFDGPLERLAVGRVAASRLQLAAGQPVPARPNFQLERLIGGTAGSEVWLARHAKTCEARVYKFGADGSRLAALKREATLSRLLRDNLGERPDFVRVLDWNFEAPPFFLECEYGGADLPTWAAEDGRLAGLAPAQRLALFLQIADAVAAAHGVGVLHKDLKPSNVLVAPREVSSWQARLTDFGSSRLLEPERLGALGITGMGLTVTGALADTSSGTPLYLAPELIAGAPPTVASDVYALGVMLYQLLAGDLQRPLAPGWERGIEDMLLREDIARATDVDPAQRLGGVPELTARLRGLADRHAERRQRQADDDEARAAREARQRNHARRPWRIAALTVLVLGVVASASLWQRSEQQRRIAEAQAARAEATIRFLSDDLIGALNPGGGGFERNPTIRDMLDYASGSAAESRLPADAATRGGIHAALGQSWRNLGERERAIAALQQAAAEYTQAFGATDATTLKARYALAHAQAYASKFADAGRELAAADEAAGARLHEDGDLALAAAVARGVFHFQQLQIEPALVAWQRADRLQRALHPQDAHLAVAIRESLADSTLRQGRLQDAVAMLQALLADPLTGAARVGENRVAAQRILLARALRNLGRHSEALPLAQQAVAVTERLSGPDAYATLTQLSLVASIHDAAGDCPSALALMRTVRARMAQRHGETRQGTLVETGNLGLKEYHCGDRQAGLDHIRRAESGLRQHYGEDNVTAQIFGYTLAGLLARESRWHDALARIDALNVPALTAGNSRPGWQERLQALRGEILIGLGQHEQGRGLIAAALPRLVALGTEEAADLERLSGLLAAR